MNRCTDRWENNFLKSSLSESHSSHFKEVLPYLVLVGFLKVEKTCSFSLSYAPIEWRKCLLLEAIEVQKCSELFESNSVHLFRWPLSGCLASILTKYYLASLPGSGAYPLFLAFMPSSLALLCRASLLGH